MMGDKKAGLGVDLKNGKKNPRLKGMDPIMDSNDF